MPQIANQDYNVIEPYFTGRTITEDAKAQLDIYSAFERGTIFDLLLKDVYGETKGVSRIVAVINYAQGGHIFYIPYDVPGGGNMLQIIIQNPDALPGLVKIQEQCTDYAFPSFELDDNGHLFVFDGNNRYITVDGNYVTGQNDGNDILVNVSVTNVQIPSEIPSAVVSNDDLATFVGTQLV
jgi:hypothetical protein